MDGVQLEFGLIGKTDKVIENYCYQKQIDDLKESLRKIQKKLFAEVGTLKKECLELREENRALRASSVEYTYNQQGYLFDIKAI